MRSDSGHDEAERFDWVSDSAIGEAGCLTFVADTHVHRVAAAFGGVLNRERVLDFEDFCEESFAWHENYPMIGVRRFGDWTLVVEDNWFEGARPEVLRRVSAGTARVASVFWNVNALTRFSWAHAGEVRTSFEALMPEIREGTEPDALETARAGLPWSDLGAGSDSPNTVSLMLALAARLTGRAVEPDWLRGEFRTYPVAVWPEDLPEVPEVLHERLTEGVEPAFVAAVRATTDAGRRQAAATIAQRVLCQARCDAEVLARPLAALLAGRPVDVPVLNSDVRSWTWQLSADRITAWRRKQINAAEVLRQAANPDTFVAVFAALSAARTRTKLTERELVADVSSVLAGV